MKETEAMKWLRVNERILQSENYGYVIYERSSRGRDSFSPFTVRLNGNLIGFGEWGLEYITSLDEAKRIADYHRQAEAGQ